MKAIAIFLLFIGMFLVVQGYYSQSTACPPQKVQVKYIPRSLYDEQLSDDPASMVSTQFKSMFEDIDPLMGRNN